MFAILPRAADFAWERGALVRDLVASLTVAVVALPLALGFGMTSGMSAAAGLTTAIIAGFVAALFGGSRYQVSGPTGAMTVVLIPIIQTYGIEAVPLLGLLAGTMVVCMGLVRLGGIINRIPDAVVEGFTVGIACVIALQQLPLALGVAKGAGEQTVIVAWHTVQNALSLGVDWQTPSMVAITLAVKFGYPRLAQRLHLRLHVPPSFVAIMVALLVAQTGVLHTRSIGDIPREIGHWQGGPVALDAVGHLLWPAFLIALLCAIESLLSARVADSMVGAGVQSRYEPDRELFGQGLATALASLFGGMPATGAIARTSVNVRAQAHSRLSAMLHAVVLVAIALLAGPWVAEIPGAAIAGVLLGTSYRILNPHALARALRTTPSQAAVLLLTALATLAIDLIWGIAIGIALYGVTARLHPVPADADGTRP